MKKNIQYKKRQKKNVKKRGEIKKEKLKKKPGQPTKLTANFIKEAEYVLFEDINAIVLTDKELVMFINERLKEEARITDRTFKNWKKMVENKKFEELDENGKAFFHLIKKAEAVQKLSLFKELRNDKQGWQRFAWIIERKFDDEWNIKHKTNVDITTKGKPLSLLSSLKNGNNNGNKENSETKKED